MSFKESTMQSLWTRYLKENGWTHPSAFELKITKNKSLPFSHIKEHQINYLIKAESKGFPYKISDASPGQKPCDSLFIKGRGYFVVMFYRPRKPKTFYCIRVHDLVRYMKSTTRKSLTEEKAIKLSEVIIRY